MLTDQVLITLIQTIGGVVLAIIGYLDLRKKLQRNNDKTEKVAVAIQDNTEKTVEIGVAVNGRVETLVQEKVDAIKLAYKTKIDTLEAHVLSLQTALDVAKVSAAELAGVHERDGNRARTLKINRPEDGKQP